MPVFRSVLALMLTSSALLAQTPETRPYSQITMQIVSLSEERFAKLLLDRPTWQEQGKPKPVFLNADETQDLLTTFQNDRHVSILCAPKMTAADKQSLTCSIGNEHVFTTNYEPKVVDGKTTLVPETKKIFDGLQSRFTPTISADRKFTTLKCQITSTTIDPVVPLMPITAFITPVFEGGSQGPPIPFTQFAQRPITNTCSLDTTVSLAEGASAVIYLGKQTVFKKAEFGPPVISRIPYLNRLFKNEGYGHEEKHLVLIVSAAVKSMPLSEALVDDYHKAISEEKYDEARQLAMKALALDPACFAK